MAVELRMSAVARAVDGRLVGPDVTVTGASIDSRTLRPGQLFVPIVGDRDGHDFVASALEAGAAGYLTARAPLSGSAVVVGDTLSALGALARHARSQLDAGRPPAHPLRVVGITGSVGKTTVKDLLAGLLAARWQTAASERSFNNELGVPLTLLNAPGDTEALIVEMGARGIGDIKDLSDLAVPSVGVVTRVAAAHTELFGTLDEIEQAKGELVEALPPDGVAVLNAEDPRVAAMALRTGARVVTFGSGGDVRAEEVVLDDELRPSFRLVSPWGPGVEVTVGSARGLHMIEGALAAATAALVCDVPLTTVASAFHHVALSPWRMQLLRASAGGVVLNDAYNANPASMQAALRSLAALPARRRVAVLGLMAELGSISDDEHRAVGELATELGIDVIAVGVDAYGGRMVATVEEAARAVGPVAEGAAVLVKGSRVAALERLADCLVANSR